jgi:acyl dehydratase
MTTATQKKPNFDHLTEEGLAELRAEIGKEIKGPPGYITETTRDGIRHFAMGIGDENPLWLDEDYAKRSPLGGLIAPPFILLALNKTAWGARGLRGIHSMFSGSSFEWMRPIRVGERITSKTTLKDIEIKKSRFAGTAIKQIREATFRDEAGKVVAIARPYSFRIERDTASSKGKYSDLVLGTYTPEQYASIAADYDKEVRRGGTPRYWEDVTVGEVLPHVVKGPLTVTDIIVFLMGFGGQWLRAHGDATRWYQRHPKGGIVNSFGAFEPPEIVHWDNELARRVGVPAAYDYGPQRVAWLGHLMTNWIGDHGFLRAMDAEVRRFNLVGDTTWCQGKVVEKWQEDGRNLVKCEIWAQDQRGDVTAKGHATVELPGKK